MEPLYAAFEIIVSMLYTMKDIFLAPIFYPHLLWVAIPIYLNLIVTDFLEEKVVTGLNQAMTNAFTVLWVGVDWLRTTSSNYLTPGLSISSVAALIFAAPLSLFLIFYGLAIIVMGVKRSPFTRYLGRVREVSYFLIVLTPIFYGVLELTPMLILTVILFLPVFYFAVEGIDRLLPTPEVERFERAWEGSPRI